MVPSLLLSIVLFIQFNRENFSIIEFRVSLCSCNSGSVGENSSNGSKDVDDMLKMGKPAVVKCNKAETIPFTQIKHVFKYHLSHLPQIRIIGSFPLSLYLPLI